MFQSSLLTKFTKNRLTINTMVIDKSECRKYAAASTIPSMIKKKIYHEVFYYGLTTARDRRRRLEGSVIRVRSR